MKRKLSITIRKQGDQMWIVPDQGQLQNAPPGGAQNAAPPPPVPAQNVVPPQGQVQNAAPPPQVPAQNVPPPQLPPQNVSQGGAQNVAPPPQGQVQNAPPQVPAAAPNRNEQFDIICFYMGQGDCSLIRCPNGKLVMIDCGSISDFPLQYKETVMNLVRHVDWAGSTMRIDALILTHSDRDHYNQVGYVLGETTTNTRKYLKLVVDKIYCSDASVERDTNHNITAISPLGNYTANGLGSKVYEPYFSTSEIQEVTICSDNDNNNFYRRWVSADQFRAWTITPIANRKYTILSGTTPGTAATGPKQWSVSLIAGNVPKVAQFADLGDGLRYMDGASEDNAKSLITLLEIGPRKLLFCGDATFSTERFLLRSHALTPLFGNVEFVLAPHHGSEWASCQPFVNAISPRRAVISAGDMQDGFKHPRATAVNRWLGKVREDVSRLIDYWEDDATEADNILQEWQAANADTRTSGNLVFLPVVPPVDPNQAVCYAISGRQWLLYRKETLLNLAETLFGIDEQNPQNPQFLRYQIR